MSWERCKDKMRKKIITAHCMRRGGVLGCILILQLFNIYINSINVINQSKEKVIDEIEEYNVQGVDFHSIQSTLNNMANQMERLEKK